MNYLCTPLDWACTKRMQAMDILGTPEAAELLADAKKLQMCYDEITKLQATVREMKKEKNKQIPILLRTDKDFYA